MPRLAAAEAIDRACPFGACDGSGWILGPEDVARPCECRERRVSRARSRGVASVIPAKYRGLGFERPPITGLDATVVGVVREYVERLDENLREGRGLWLMGDVGTGKTSLAMLVSKAALEHGCSVAIYSLPRLLARIRRTYDAEAGEQSYLEFFKRLTAVDLLHVDDLGAEKRSDWVLEQLYALVDERYESQRSIVVTTNLDQASLEDQIGARTVSRLVEVCGDPLPLFGDDLRYRIDAS
ncbi:MAG TPA: ATP-binding protein [Solirubrobacterales bacterium]|nr:ATP-binding protein [Solirubrobacterales bacterium]